MEVAFCSQEGRQAECQQNSVKEKAKKILRKYDVGDRFSHLTFPKASVLLPVLMKHGKLHVLFTLRSMKLKTSPGEVCFPGGRGEPKDRDEIETALREAEEEVGLLSGQVEFISRLVPAFSKVCKSHQYECCSSMSSPFIKKITTPTFIDRTLVTPVVAIVPETFQACPNPAEVADVFLVPLDYFIKPGQHFEVPLKSVHPTKVLHFFKYKDPESNRVFMIWGLTAHFALMLAVLLLEERPSFNNTFDVDHQISLTEQMLLALNKSKL